MECDPAHPRDRHCSRYADGLTSIVDLAADRRRVYALSLSKMGWLAMESGAPEAAVGGLFEVKRAWHGKSGHKPADGWYKTRVREVRTSEPLIMPGGVDVGEHGDLYVVGPLLGPGALMELDD